AAKQYAEEQRYDFRVLRTYIYGGIAVLFVYGIAFLTVGGFATVLNLIACMVAIAALAVALFMQRSGRTVPAAVLALSAPPLAVVTFAWVFSAETGVALVLVVSVVAGF